MSVSARIAIRGKYLDETTSETKTATIATISNIRLKNDTESEGHSFERLAGYAGEIADAAQLCVSATVTGYTITTGEVPMTDPEYYTPGNPLRSEEIFSEDFSDTQVVPTLQITNANATGGKKVFNFKYMADPVDTSDFNENAVALAEILGNLEIISGESVSKYDTFVKGDLSFSAKDTVAEPM